MSAIILDGKARAAQRIPQLQQLIKDNIDTIGRPPALAVFLVGDHGPSKIYVKNKVKACDILGIKSTIINLAGTTTDTELYKNIKKLDHNNAIDGIILQSPLPPPLSMPDFINCISPHKDVDGFHPLNMGKLALRQPGLRPSTPAGIIDLLTLTNTELTGKYAVVVGASNIVGRPMALELLLQGVTTTICHRFTQNLAGFIKDADLLISAIGKTNVIPSDKIKIGAIVVDVAINRLPNGKLCGDIDFTIAAQRASYITPVPGGVGPMTVSKLMENTISAWINNNN